jgi:hypothetical protein
MHRRMAADLQKWRREAAWFLIGNLEERDVE